MFFLAVASAAGGSRSHRGRLWRSDDGGVLEGSSSARRMPRYSLGYPVPQESKIGNHFALHLQIG